MIYFVSYTGSIYCSYIDNLNVTILNVLILLLYYGSDIHLAQTIVL